MSPVVFLVLLAAGNVDQPSSAPSVQAPQRPLHLEIWIEPLSPIPTLLLGGGVHFSLGASVAVASGWELDVDFAFSNGQQVLVDRDVTAPGSQYWLSLAPVKHFDEGSGSGWFIGPRLTGSVMSVGSVTSTDNVLANDFEVGIEAGYRFRFDRFTLSLLLPTVSIGYAWNHEPGWFSLVGGFFATNPVPRAQGAVIGVDIPLARLGAAF